ncbi:MAG: PRC-barrel domain-containing protein, partial [Burkholderiales bacterium]
GRVVTLRSNAMKIDVAEKKIVTMFFSLALVSVVAAMAYAQDKAPVAGLVPLGVAVVETEAVATGWRASKLMHADVYNDSNQKIGKIDDFIVSPDGKLSVAVVDVGGFLGLAAHRVAIPVEQFGKVAPKVVLKGATKEALKVLPEFKYAA